MNNSLYLDITRDIEQQIRDGILEPGDKLPSERIMTSQYNVSRIVVREAIKVLHAKGLVIVKSGKGTYVTKPKDQVVTDSIKRVVAKYDAPLEDFLEVREELELSIIRKAVAKASPADIEALREIYQAMESKRFLLKEYVEEDLKFHVTLAECTHNRIFLVLVNSFFELTERSLIDVTRYTNSVHEAQKHHIKLIEAIESRDEEAAVHVMKEHMDLIRSEIRYLREMNLI